jgi:hypothetical protein
VKKILIGELETLVGACGVGILYEYAIDDDDDGVFGEVEPREFAEAGGAGWTCAGFIEADYCKDTWNYLTKRFKLVYKTPIRKNKNSGNDFFFAVFDGMEKRPAKARALKWPFKDKK